LQVVTSGEKAIAALTAHFVRIKEVVNSAVDARLQELVMEVRDMREASLQPLKECRTLIGKSVEIASHVMEEGSLIWCHCFCINPCNPGSPAIFY
jgi:hypothetical protein